MFQNFELQLRGKSTSKLCKDPDQIALERQFDQDLSMHYTGKHFVYPYPKTNILFKSRKRKVFEILEDLPKECLITKKGLNILFVHLAN